jgi:hypothetical protein
VKQCLRGQWLEIADEPFLAIDAVLRSPEERTLHAVFLYRMHRLVPYHETNGDYFEGIDKILGRNQFYVVDIAMPMVR